MPVANRTHRETPEPTRHEAAGSPTATRREGTAAGLGGPGPGPFDIALLPEHLRPHLVDLTPMPLQGGEADLLRARDSRADRQVVLKVYRPQLRPDQSVWEKLTSVRSPYVVQINEVGELSDGRCFELMEYLPHGSLRDLGAGSKVFPTAEVERIVGQLAEGLAALHAENITHRDLKPENVLVRSIEPVHLVLTDFGLARRLEHTAMFSTAARTAAYAAPEAYTGHLSPARDWWSLGVLIVELVTGVRAFHGLDELTIQLAVTTKLVPVDAVTDRRLNRLCAGLLVPDKAQRWRWDQVRDWLAGGMPSLPTRRISTDVRAFAFEGETYTAPEELAAAMAEHWNAAVRRFLVSMGEAWEALKAWLRQFDDPNVYPPEAVARRQELLDELQRSRQRPEHKLLRLLAELNPQLPPTYRGTLLDVDELRRITQRALDGDPRDPATIGAASAIDEMWNERLIPMLARFDGGAALASIDGAWRKCVAHWDAVTGELSGDPRLRPVFATPGVAAAGRTAMLELATGLDRGPDWRQALGHRAGSLPVPVDWLGSMIGWAGSDPVRLYAAWCASGAAQAEADQVVREQRAAEEARRQRYQSWQAREADRLAGRGAAIGRGLAGVGIVWVLLLVPSAGNQQSLGAVVALGAFMVAAELSLAAALGRDYHPRYSMTQMLARRAGAIGWRMRSRPLLWAFGLLVLLVWGIAVIAALVPLVALVIGVAHLVWALTRYVNWSKVHGDEQRQAMQA